MRILRQFGVVVLLLMSYLTPAMACMISDVQMSAEERACCRAMKNQCEQMGMPVSHGCCQKAPLRPYDNALNTKAVTLHPVVAAAIRLTASEWLNPTSIVARWVEQPDYSPPTSPPAAVSILKI